MKIGKISLKDLEDLATDLESNVYTDRNFAFKEIDEMLYNKDFKHKLNIPNEYERDALLLTTGRDMVDTFCNHTNISNASIRNTWKGESGKTKEESEMERHFGAGVMYMTNLNSEVSPWWDCSKHYWEHGMGVLKQLYIADAWGGKPRKKKGESDESYSERVDEWTGQASKDFPIKVLAVHPCNVFPDPDPYSTDFVVEINYYHWIKARAKYPFWDNPLGRGAGDAGKNVRDITFYTPEYRIHIIDGQSVIRTPSGVDYHNYGCLPYTIFNSGLGSITHDNDMSKRYVGLLRFVEDLLIAESSAFSVNHAVLKKAAWPGGFLRGDTGGVVIKEEYGVWNPLPEGVELIEYQHRTAPAEVLNEFVMLHSLLSEHGAPRSMQGMGEEGVRSGADRRLLLAESTTRLEQSIQTFKNRTAKVLENCAKIFVNAVPGNVKVWARDPIPSFDAEIDKKKMKEPFNYTVEFSPVSPEDEYRRDDARIRKISAGLYDRTKAWEEMPHVDPEDMARRVEKQRIADDPILNQMLGQVYAQIAQGVLSKKMGQNALMEALQQEGQQGGQPMEEMGGMTTNIPNQVVPGSAEQIMQDRRRMLQTGRMGSPTAPMQGAFGGGERGVNR